MPIIGKAEPAMEKPSMAHSEQILIDMRSEGIRPKMKMPKPMELNTSSRARRVIFHSPP